MDTPNLQAKIDTLEQQAQKLYAPCHGGDLVFRRWTGPASTPTLLLVHGGSGSWLHWFQNIPSLLAYCHIVAVDLPGLGDSAALPTNYSATDAIDVFVAGCREVLPNEPFHIAAFSWGCAVAAQASSQLEPQLRSVLLAGPASLGDIPRREMMKPLLKRSTDMTQAQIYATHRENLARLMIYDRSRIDDMAVYIQTLNTRQARFNSPQFSRTSLAIDGVAATSVPTKVIYGEFDAPALPDITGKRALFEDAGASIDFDVIADAGHWVQYEQPDAYNKMALHWLMKHRY